MSKIETWKGITLSEAGKNAINALKNGQVLAVRMRHVKSTIDSLPKVQIEFAEKLGGPTAVKSAASMFNAKDDRFSTGAQRCWETADLSIAEQMFGEIPEGESHVEILKVLEPVNGEDFRMQYTEALESELSEKEAPYAENYLKRAGKEGNYFFTPSGERVISRKRLVQVPSGTNPVNTYLSGAFAKEGNVEAHVLSSKPAIAADVLAGG
tara:strand:- start:3794 stop:4423 length:630 start_codon:yes stop_codon:yes gene_type:complete